MSEHFNNQAAADRFADDLLDLLTDTYYVWTDNSAKDSWIGSRKKCTMARGYRAIPEKAEEVFTGQAISHAISEMRFKGWKNVSDHHSFKDAAKEVGFTVREFYGTTVITL